MNVARGQFPAHNRVAQCRVTGIPGVDQEARRIDFKILTLHAELGSIVADPAGFPLAAGAHVRMRFGYAVQTFLTPPFCSLRGISYRLENACRWSCDENLNHNTVVV